MNKFILLGLFSICSPFFTGAQKTEETLKWESWNEGYPRAIREKKIALIDAYTDWCGWCKKMDRDTYSNEDIIRKLNKYFVLIKFNPEIQNVRYELNGRTYTGFELHMMISNNQRLGYPTTYFIVTTKNRLIIQPGYFNPEDFGQLLDSIIQESQSTN